MYTKINKRIGEEKYYEETGSNIWSHNIPNFPPVRLNGGKPGGGGIFGFAKNPNEIGQEITPEGPNTDAATSPTNSGNWIDSGNYNTNWSGSGTEADPYLITSEEQLAGLSYMVYSGKGPSESASYNKNFYINKYFKQTQNLDMSAYYWQPIGICYNRSGTQTERYFSGIYEGSGYTVSGIFTKAGTTNAYSYQGLFGYTYGATIKNVGIKDSYIQGYECIGGLIGEAYSNTTIANCYNTSDVKGSGNNIGGLVGQAYLNITISNCYNTGAVNGLVYIGGLVGEAYFTTIANCYNTSDVKGSGNNIGGLVGNAYSDKISNCYNTGSVSGSDNINVGGLVGYGSSAGMNNCYYGGNCTLTKEFGNGSTQGNKVTNLNTTSYAKNKTWYTTTSNWNADYPWDFDNIWVIDATFNDGYPMLKQALAGMTYYLDAVNGRLDGVQTDTLENYGTCDVYIDGVKVANKVTDHYEKYYYGQTYKIVCYPATDKEFVGGYSGTLEGTITETITMWLEFRTKTWEDYASTNYASGSGTEASPYIIKTPEQLAKFAKDSNGSNNLHTTYFKLGASIDLSAHVWNGIGKTTYFEGSFDGDFYAIKNIKTSADFYVPGKSGLFIHTGGQAEIKNIIMKGGFIKSSDSAGAIADTISGNIVNCIVDGVNIEGQSTIGGIVSIGGNVKGCIYKNGELKSIGDSGGEKKAGGIVGWANGRIEDCSTINVNITARTYYGLIVAQPYHTATITANYGQGIINGTAKKIMYGDSSVWGNWTYSSILNNGYPVQKALVHLGGLIGSTDVYSYLISRGFGENMYDPSKAQLDSKITLNDDNSFTFVSNASGNGTAYCNFGYSYDSKIPPNTDITVVYELISVEAINPMIIFCSPFDAGSNPLDVGADQICLSANPPTGNKPSIQVTTFTTNSLNDREFNFRSYIVYDLSQSINITFRISVFIGDIKIDVDNFEYNFFN